MNSIEQASLFEDMPDFDVNAAFQDAIAGVASDVELALEEKVRRMELIIHEGADEIYREFIDFSQLAAQMEMMCLHDHDLAESVRGSETLSGFMDGRRSTGDDDTSSIFLQTKRSRHDDDTYEVDPVTGKKVKKSKHQGWLSALLKLSN